MTTHNCLGRLNIHGGTCNMLVRTKLNLIEICVEETQHRVMQSSQYVGAHEHQKFRIRRF
jgi:hypothetical protein